MTQYEVEFTIWGEYPSSYDGICQVGLSDDEVQQLVTLMQEYNTCDSEELNLEVNLPEIYEKLCSACDKVAIDIVERDWLDSAIWHLADCDYDEDELISYCQEQFDCPEFDKDDEGNFNNWLHDFWKTATIEEQKDLCFGYMGFDESDLAEVRCCVGEQYEIPIPESIIQMANLKQDIDRSVVEVDKGSKSRNLTFKEHNGAYFFYNNGKPFLSPYGHWVSTKSLDLAEMIVQDSRNPEVYNTGSSILTFHYRQYIPFAVDYSDQTYLWNLIIPCDPFLMFHKLDGYDEFDYSLKISERFNQNALHRNMCYHVIDNIYNSLILADRIVEDIIEREGDYEVKKEQFLNDIEEYVANSKTSIDITRSKLSVIIDKFVFYYSLDEV